MKTSFFLIGSLTLISAVCAAVLAGVDEATRDPIAEIRVRQAQDAVKAVLPTAAIGEPFEVEGCPGVFAAKDASGQVVGYAARGLDAGGYGGEIELMVGFRSDKTTLVGYRTLRASETPGLGMKLNTVEFKSQFAGMDARHIRVKVDGGSVEAISSATITSRAVCRAIEDARAKLP